MPTFAALRTNGSYVQKVYFAKSRGRPIAVTLCSTKSLRLQPALQTLAVAEFGHTTKPRQFFLRHSTSISSGHERDKRCGWRDMAAILYSKTKTGGLAL